MRNRSGNPGVDEGPPAVGLLRRLLAGLPSASADLVTASVCIAVWWAPQSWPEDLLRSTALIMLIEFLSIHSLIIAPVLAVLLTERWPYAGLILILLLYLGVAVGVSVALQTWWPTVFFAWLLLSRYVLPMWNIGGGDEHIDLGKVWLVSTLLWLLLIFASLILPVPALGWDADAIARLGLPGGGIWVDQPHRLLAFAASYFLLLAAFKLLARPEPPSGKRRPMSRAERRRIANEDRRAR